MILFDLKCPHDHGFEAWFRDGATYQAQVAAGAIACPVCGDTRIAKAPMAPRIAKHPLGEAAAAGRSDAGPVAADSRAMMVEEPLRAQLDAMRQHVEKNCEAVGDKFAEEARKIHYGEAPHRDIYGQATDAEAEELVEEGVEFARVPWPARSDS